ncbi:MAG: alcohol dehydrogenase [Acidimicrobiales bacterium]|nr:MAG: alcohol dehydrogenase [Acidimicrobiales bacterium]
MRAAVLSKPAKISERPLVIEDLPDPTPGPGELCLRVEACAACRTDLQLVEGDLPPRRLPITPGHQVVGVVAAHGPGVSRPPLGSRVGVAWLGRSCGECRFCRSDRENLCESARFTGWDRDGGFAEMMTVDAAFAYELEDECDPVALAPLLCGGAIGWRCLRVADVRAGGRLGLYGFGASASIVAQIAVARGVEVYVVTRSEKERRRAEELGAVWTGAPGVRPPVPLDWAITFAPVGDVVVDALAAVDRGGIVVVNAIHLDRIPQFPYELLWWERCLRSVANVTRDDVRGLLREAAATGVRTRFDVYPLDAANEALRAIAEGTVNTAAVLVPGAVSLSGP